jgi:hypothetical protein
MRRHSGAGFLNTVRARILRSPSFCSPVAKVVGYSGRIVYDTRAV